MGSKQRFWWIIGESYRDFGGEKMSKNGPVVVNGIQIAVWSSPLSEWIYYFVLVVRRLAWCRCGFAVQTQAGPRLCR